MVFVLDNYDSFTYNLVQYMGEMGAELVIRRNDEITPEDVAALHPDRIVISPGPCTPGEAGISVALVQHFARHDTAALQADPGHRPTPILGVCLGHQAIGEAFGGTVVRASRLMHGKTSPVTHDGETIFAGLPPVTPATRYHSLVVRESNLPGELAVSARTAEPGGESTIMGLRHRTLPIEGVQFHPESVLTTHGRQMIRNFLDLNRTPGAA